MKRLLLIVVLLGFLFAIGLLFDVIRSSLVRRSLQSQTSQITEQAARFLPYFPDKAISYLKREEKAKGFQFVEGTPQLKSNNHILVVTTKEKVPLYAMRLLGNAYNEYYGSAVATVEVSGAGVVGKLPSDWVKLAFEIHTALDYQTVYRVRPAGSFQPRLADEYIQYFFIDRKEKKEIIARQSIDFEDQPSSVKKVLNFKGKPQPIFVAVLKNKTSRVAGFAEFVVQKIEGEDLIGYFVKGYVPIAIPDNPQADYYGLFAEGEKKITVE